MFFPYKIIDLTHELSSRTPTWDSEVGFSTNTLLDYNDCKTKVKFRVQEMKMAAGVGTHIDAPAHCNPHGSTIEELNITDLIAPCSVIDVSNKCSEKYLVSCDDLDDFEKKFGSIKPNSLVLIYTGWDQFWIDPQKYRNNLCFPTISPKVAEALIEKKITGLGIDTLSPDRSDGDFPVHNIILGAGKYIVENVAHASLLPKVGSFTVALPIKIVQATEAPLRLIALVPID